MTRTLEISLKAREDLEQIEDRIAADNPQAAFVFIEAVADTFERIAQWPESGRALHRKDYRATCVSQFSQYLVIWRVLSDGVEVSRIFRGDLDLFRVLPGKDARTGE